LSVFAIQEVTEYMFDNDVLNIRRREMLHHKWTDRVYDPICRHLLSVQRSKDFKNMRIHKQHLYDAFLAKCNRKVCLSVCLSVCCLSLSLCLFVCLSGLSVCLVYLSNQV